MPSLSLFLARARGARTRQGRSFSWRSWWTAACFDSSRGSSLNNLVFWCCAGRLSSASFHFSFDHQGDGGGGWWYVVAGRLARLRSSAAAIFGSSSSATLRRPWATQLPTLMVEWRPLQALTHVAIGRRQRLFNLQACEPKGRPYSSSSMASSGDFVPSGTVPGDEVASHGWVQRCERGGLGLDCFFYLCFRVLCANRETLVVFFHFQEVLHVKCTTTGLD